MILNPESRRVPPCIRLIALCLLTLFSNTSKTEAAPIFEPVRAFELSPKDPQSKLIQGSDGDFYGTSFSGGSSGMGTVFKMSPGGVVTTLVNFTGANGNGPLAGLLQGRDGNFYGTTSADGLGGCGTIFRMTPGGSLTTLANFGGSDGRDSQAALVEGADGVFYGTTFKGGSRDKGVVFKVTSGGTLTTLVNFSGPNGANPQAELVLANDENFYGTTLKGGSDSGNGFGGDGTVFRMTPDGMLTTLTNFVFTNGSAPTAGLIQGSDGNFYGTTSYGGIVESGYGTVFKITSNGILTTLVHFTQSGGSKPHATMIAGRDGNFYGTTTQGGKAFNGTVFKMTPDGTLSTLVDLERAGGVPRRAALVLGSDGNFYSTTGRVGSEIDGGSNGSIYRITQDGTQTVLVDFADVSGRTPEGKLVQGRDGNLYGTTCRGGSGNIGTVFKMTHDGMLTTLVNFDHTNGSYPEAGLVQGTDGNFYGTTAEGGDFDDGTVFKMTPDGTLTTLVSFSGTNGKYPRGGLIQGVDGNFFGTTYHGGTNYEGILFKMTPGGTLTPLVNFTGANGSSPVAGLIRSDDGNFYGTTPSGGSNDLGTVFKMTPSGTMTTLVNFTGSNGRSPYAGLIQASDGNFYGTTSAGGSSSIPDGSYGYGTVFRITPTGILTTMVNFSEISLGIPYAGLVEGNDGNFYGVTPGNVYAGTYGKVFQMTPAGAVSTVRDFSDHDGKNPQFAALVQGSDGNLYGTTTAGGTTSEGRPAGGGQIFRLRMDPIPAPEITIESPGATALADGTSAVSFGSVAKTSSASMIFSVGNKGTADLTGLTLSVDGANAADFSITSYPAALVAGPTGITTFTVRFSPQSAGARTAALHIGSNDSDESPFDIVLTGSGKAIPIFPEIVVEQPAGSNLADGRTKISFGTSKVGKTGITKTFTIKNTGTAPLTSIAISMDGNHRKDFIVTPSGKTSLAPGSSTSFKVKFQPTAKGTRDAWIHLRSNDADESKFDIKLTGLGAPK